jgi:hypothetical protein
MSKSYNMNFQCAGDEADALKQATEFVASLRASGHTVHVAALTYGGAQNLLVTIPAPEEKAGGKIIEMPGAKKSDENSAAPPSETSSAVPPIESAPTATAKQKCPACNGSGTMIAGSGVPCEKCGGTGDVAAAN